METSTKYHHDTKKEHLQSQAKSRRSKHIGSAVQWGTSLRRMQCTMTMTKPSRESKTAKRIWKSAERRSVIARTADIQVRARRGRTTQELHSDALQEGKGITVKDSSSKPLITWHREKPKCFLTSMMQKHFMFSISYDYYFVLYSMLVLN